MLALKQCCGHYRQVLAWPTGRVLPAIACQSYSTGVLANLTPKSEDICKRLVGGERAALARAITCVESTRSDDRAQAQAMLAKLARSTRRTVRARSTFRIGISGPPGAGKSTLMEALGCHLISLGHKVAVLAVDPSSSITGGSILGDKTRMDKLSVDPRAFVRPSASRGTLGGVARNTNESMALCEAAGYDIVLVETVGVGQSETAVADMVDMFVLLLPPAAGDELQGIKKGVMELAQLVIVNKADGDLLPAANRAAGEIISALKILRPTSRHWRTPVLTISARNVKGIDKAWKTMEEFRDKMTDNGALQNTRAIQRRVQMWNYINSDLIERFRSNPEIQAKLPALQDEVVLGTVLPGLAADQLMHIFLPDTKKP